jgi:hypothetical protein
MAARVFAVKATAAALALSQRAVAAATEAALEATVAADLEAG